jgi:hypothetical protein
MWSLILTLLSAAVAAASTYFGVNALTYAATVFTFIGAYLQYIEAQPYEQFFQSEDWNNMGLGTQDSELVIVKGRHGKNKGTATVFSWQAAGYAAGYVQADCMVFAEDDGSIRVRSSIPFRGKLVIK